MNNFPTHSESVLRRYLSEMRDQQWALLAALLPIVLGSCKKDADNEAPLVSILIPAAGSTVAIPDTLALRVQVTDDGTVEHITVFIVDEFGVPITASVTASVGSSSATVDLALPILSERLESGMYTIVARASDGESDGMAFTELLVQAAPLRSRSIFLLPPASSPPPFPVLRIDSTGSVTTWMTQNEMSGSAIGLDHLFLAGTTNDDLIQVEVNSGSSTSLLMNPGAGSGSYFRGLVLDPSDNRLYVGLRDGYLRGFNESGIASYTSTAPTGWYSEHTAVTHDRLMSAAVNPISAQRALMTYDLGTGTYMVQFPLDNEPVALFESDNDHVLVFGNRNGDGVIQERNTELGGVFEMREFPGDPIRNVVRTNSDTYIIARATGIARFNYSSNGLVTISSTAVDALAYDKVSGALLIGVGSNLITMDPSNGNLLDSRSMPTSIGAILLLTNR